MGERDKMKKQTILLTLILVSIIALCGTVSAADNNTTNPDPPLTILKGSSDTVGGLDTKVDQGPNQTVIQYHITTNDSVNTAHYVNATFSWTSSNSNINLAPGQSNVINLGNISALQTIDAFYLVEFTRNVAAIGTNRSYQIVFAGTDTPTYTMTGTIVISTLLSQNRNSITGITVNNTHPQIGDNITVTVTSTTSSSGFALVSFPLLSYNPSMLQITRLVTTYTDSGGVGRTSNDVTLLNPNSNAFTSTYTLLVTSANISSIYAVFMDQGSGKYHYNSDYGTDVVSTYVPASVGNLVWDDLNANGKFDAGEPGIPNVLVTLYATNGTALETRTTNVSGFFYFTELYPQSYYLKFTLPSGYNISPLFGTGYDNKANPANGTTAIFTLSPGQNDYTWDAGMYKNATVGDFVWNDQNADGYYQGRGAGLPGVTVTLYRSTGSPVGSTTTDSNGYYFFNNLLPGSYFISFVLLAGYNFSPYIPGVTNNKANSTGGTTTFNLISGQTDLTWDAAMYRNGTIGNLAWNDTNANGIQDAGETGLAGVTVKLYNSLNNVLLATTTTDSNGYYQFTNVKPGDAYNGEYYLEFIKPLGWNFSPAFQGTNGTIDSDVYPNTGQTPQITLNSGQNLTNWDAGLYQNVTIGDFVWMDLNLNGFYEPGLGDYPLANIIVRLYNSAGTHLESTTTDTNGNYLFNKLVPGTYYLEFVTPTGYVRSDYIQGVTQNTANRTTGFTVNTTLTSGQSQLNWDAGMLSPELYYGHLGNFVWNDQNADGMYDGTGHGLPGITVNLYLENNLSTPIQSTVTDSNGYYNFYNVTPTRDIPNGYRYIIKFNLPTGYQYSPFISGVTDNKAHINGRTDPITLNIGQTDLDWDAGMWQPANIGVFVWKDLNANGIQDIGEPGLADVTVELHNMTDALVDTTTTDSGGYYMFYDVAPGNYYVKFIKPAGWNFSPAFQGDNADFDSDAYPNTGKTPEITITSGQNQLNWDAGLYQNATMGGFVWMDLNLNGYYEPGLGDYALRNIVVRLYNSEGTHLESEVTDANGNYAFNNMVPGTYYLQFVAPTGYTISNYIQGVTRNTANSTTGYTINTSLISGESETYWDAGMNGTELYYASLGDFVWNDQNADGMYDGTGHGLPGITVNLYLENNLSTPIQTTTTNSDGYYRFNNLTPTTVSGLRFIVQFILPSGFRYSPYIAGVTDNKAHLNGRTDPINLTVGQVDLEWDAGMYQNGNIGSFVWNDTNANGIQEGSEPGLVGVTVQLHNSVTDALLRTTTTDSGGYYYFNNVTPGSYYVKFIKPTGWNFSPAFQGTDDEVDSDAYPDTGKTPQITLNSGENQMNWDAGFYQNATIGDFVWMDLNLDGYYNVTLGDYPLSNIVVRLYNSLGTHLQSTNTDENGNYLFTNIIPGNYYLEFVKPTGYLISDYIAGVTQNTANATGFTTTFALNSGDSQLAWDAGMLSPDLYYATIGNFVWDDQNADGIYQGRGGGIEGVTVNLYLENNLTTPIATTVTVPDGFYMFYNLIPTADLGGLRYVVQFILPDSSWYFSPYVAGVTNNKAHANGFTDYITLATDQTDLEWDAGMYRLGSIGNLVWEDLNGNGIQDIGEPGLAGVTVELYNSTSNALVKTTTTNSSGNYLFSDLTPADYYVMVTKPTADWKFSPQFQGTDDTKYSTVYTTNGKTPQITLNSGQNQLNWDAGLYKYATIGDFVWTDLNANGIKDVNETGLSNVIVNLYTHAGALLDSTSTDANGYFSFSNAPGSYYLEFVTPTGYYISPFFGTGYDNKANSTGQTTNFTVVSGDSQLGWDAGMWQPASIGNWVWNDQNADGIYNGRGWGLDGVTVELYNPSDLINPIITTVTANNGFYYFTNLLPGTYVVKFYTLPGFTFSPANQGTDPTRNSKANPETGFTDPVYVVSGENNPYVDAAMYQPVAIGSLVWTDLNFNGILEAGEPGYAGVVVELYNGLTNVLVNTTTTNSTGNYIFENLVPNFYFVKFILPLGHTFSPQYAVEDPAISSAANPVNGAAATREYTSGVENMNVNAGINGEADVELTQTANVSNDIVIFNVTATNYGPDNAHNVTIVDTIPAGLTSPVVSVTAGSYTITDGVITWIVDINNGSNATMTITGTAIPQSTITNTANKTNQTEYDPTVPDTVTTSVYTRGVDVSVVILPWYYLDVDGKYQYKYVLGNTPVFVWSVINSNTLDEATGVIAEFIIPQGFEYIASSCGEYGTLLYQYNETSRTGTLTWNIGYMPQSGNATTYITLKVNTIGNRTADLTLTSNLIHLDQYDVNPANNQNITCAIESPPSADIQVNQTYVQNGSQVIYTITVKNNGPSDSTGLQITDILPSGVTWVSDTSGGIYNHNKSGTGAGIWNVGNITSGDTKTLNITVTVTATTGTIKNSARITKQVEKDINYNNNGQSTYITITGPYVPTTNVGIWIDPWYYQQGSKTSLFTYVMDTTPVFMWNVVNSNSRDEVNNIAAEFIIPQGFEYLGSTCLNYGTITYQYNATSNTGKLIWNIGYMPQAGNAMAYIVLRVIEVGNRTSDLTLTSNLISGGQNDINHTNDQNITCAIESPPSADIQVNQTYTTYTESNNNYAVYTITVKNNGPSNATGVQITDILPTGVTWISDTSGGTYNHNTIGTDAGLWNVGDINNGETKTLQITVLINPTTTGTIINTAKTSKLMESDTNYNNNGQSTYITIGS
jgi:uncharacterized repeat protein (TIGR01451 family)